jgi:uncharacterized protein (DUF1697 family)
MQLQPRGNARIACNRVYANPSLKAIPAFGDRSGLDEEPPNGKPVTTMALIVFLRGVNVGGHRTFRPTSLAKDLSEYDVVNVGAAGTFVVRNPGSRAKFRTALLRQLPFDTKVMFCNGRDLIRLETENPFGAEPSSPDVVRFMSILSRGGRGPADVRFSLPPGEDWLLRVIASKNRFVFEMYRRHMKTIGYLGQMDKLFGVPTTTRNWNTILAVVRILKGRDKKAAARSHGGPISH